MILLKWVVTALMVDRFVFILCGTESLIGARSDVSESLKR